MALRWTNSPSIHGWSAFGSLEADASVVGVGVDGVTPLVDDDVVVVPTQGYEILRIGGSALGPGGDVVDLEPVSAVAGVGSALIVVAVEDGSA
jgi:hypothetical protein